MKKTKWFVSFAFLFTVTTFPQINYCLNFQLKYQKSWNYFSGDSTMTITAEVGDSVRINDHLYYEYYPYGDDYQFFKYYLRHGGNQVLALNTADSSDYLLFDFSAEVNNNWTIPASGSPPINQCDWGSKITLISMNETIETPQRKYFNCYKFGHSEHPCSDAGHLVTWFARDFGIVKFALNSEAGVIDYYLDSGEPDTISITGNYGFVGNPCLTVPCLPCIVSAVTSNDSNYVLTIEDRMFCDEFSWNGYTPSWEDSIYVKGILTERRDIYKKYRTLEIIDLYKIEITDAEDLEEAKNISGFAIFQNYPNPFNPSTLIIFSLSDACRVKVIVFDIMGRQLKTLLNNDLPIGKHEVQFNGEGFPSGVYYFQIIAQGKIKTRPMVLLR